MKKFLIVSVSLLLLLATFACKGNTKGGSGLKALSAPSQVKAEPTLEFNKLKVTWENVDHNEGYVVSYKAVNNGSLKTQAVERNRQEVELAALDAGVEYAITVRAKGGKQFKDSPESAEVRATPKGKKNAKQLPVPTNLHAESTGKRGEVKVWWDPIKDPDTKEDLPEGYVIFYKETASSAGKQKFTTKGAQITKFFTTLTDNVEYSFSIKALAKPTDEKWDDSPESAEVKATPKYESRLYVRGIYIADDYDPAATSPNPLQTIEEHTLARIIDAPANTIPHDKQQKNEITQDVLKREGKQLMFSIAFSSLKETIKSVKFDGVSPKVKAQKLGNLDEYDFYYKTCPFTDGKVVINMQVIMDDDRKINRTYTFVQKEFSVNTNIKKVVIGGTEYDPFVMAGEEIAVYVPKEKVGKQTVSLILEDPKSKYRLYELKRTEAEEVFFPVQPGAEINITGKDEGAPFAVTVIPEGGEFYKWDGQRIQVFAGYPDAPKISEIESFKIGSVEVKGATTKEKAVAVTENAFTEKMEINAGEEKHGPPITNDYIEAFTRESFDKLMKIPQNQLYQTDSNDYLAEGDALTDEPREFVIFLAGDLFVKDPDSGESYKPTFYHIWLKKKH